VLLAWGLAKAEKDPAASIRYASAFGAGLVAVGRYGEAMTPLNEAIKIAQAHPEVAYPTLAINTKIDALAGLHRENEALQLANDSLSRLRGTQFDGQKPKPTYRVAGSIPILAIKELRSLITRLRWISPIICTITVD
jgi:hypothetical protein